MAFFDFLGQPVGGTSFDATGAMQTPNAVTNPTWGQLIQTGINQGSAPGSRTPMYTQAAMNQLMPMPEAQQKQAGMKDQDSLSQIVSLLASLFAGGA